MEDVLVRAAVVVAILGAAGAFGWWWSRRSGAVREDGDGRFADHELAAVGLDGGGPEVRALLLGSPTCAPCRSVKDVLAEVEAERDGFRWVSVDAAEHLPITREHHVLRVPTLFVIDREGRILARTSGVPATRELLRVVDRDHTG